MSSTNLNFHVDDCLTVPKGPLYPPSLYRPDSEVLGPESVRLSAKVANLAGPPDHYEAYPEKVVISDPDGVELIDATSAVEPDSIHAGTGSESNFLFFTLLVDSLSPNTQYNNFELTVSGSAEDGSS